VLAAQSLDRSKTLPMLRLGFSMRTTRQDRRVVEPNVLADASARVGLDRAEFGRLIRWRGRRGIARRIG
jgi:hypothetical protein